MITFVDESVQVLRRVAGEEADRFMEGRERIMGVKHEHSDAAYRMLERYAVDKCFQNEDNLLKGDAMLLKVGNLGDKYWTWIHQPYEGSLRLFESDMLEMLTRTSWWVVPVVWMPLVIFFTARGFRL
uniref:SH3 domain-containing protein n=1 Tax=Parascaris equorum TaxID=6256 RepID=A0A914RKQ7_PAREQ